VHLRAPQHLHAAPSNINSPTLEKMGHDRLQCHI
jgi:hypothetical protein